MGEQLNGGEYALDREEVERRFFVRKSAKKGFNDEKGKLLPQDQTVELENNVDIFGVRRGRCRCGKCPGFVRGLSRHESCSDCLCPSNRHRRLTFVKATNFHAKPLEVNDEEPGLIRNNQECEVDNAGNKEKEEKGNYFKHEFDSHAKERHAEELDSESQVNAKKGGPFVPVTNAMPIRLKAEVELHEQNNSAQTSPIGSDSKQTNAEIAESRDNSDIHIIEDKCLESGHFAGIKEGQAHIDKEAPPSSGDIWQCDTHPRDKVFDCSIDNDLAPDEDISSVKADIALDNVRKANLEPPIDAECHKSNAAEQSFVEMKGLRFDDTEGGGEIEIDLSHAPDAVLGAPEYPCSDKANIEIHDFHGSSDYANASASTDPPASFSDSLQRDRAEEVCQNSAEEVAAEEGFQPLGADMHLAHECSIGLEYEHSFVKSQSEDVKIEEIKVQETKVQETKVQETKVQETKVQETKVEETKVDYCQVEESEMTDGSSEEAKVNDVDTRRETPGFPVGSFPVSPTEEEMVNQILQGSTLAHDTSPVTTSIGCTMAEKEKKQNTKAINRPKPQGSSSDSDTMPRASRLSKHREGKRSSTPKGRLVPLAGFADAKQATRSKTPTQKSATRKPDNENVSSKQDLLQQKLEGEIDSWRQRVQFALSNEDFSKAVSLCDSMIQRLATLGETRAVWRLPLLAQRAFIRFKWSNFIQRQSSSSKPASMGNSSAMNAERLRELVRQDLCCVADEKEVPMTNAGGKALVGVASLIRGMLETACGQFPSALRSISKGRELFRQHGATLNLWGFQTIEKEASDFVTLANKLSVSLSQAEDAIRSKNARRCLRFVENLLNACPRSHRGLALKAEALALGCHSTARALSTLTSKSDALSSDIESARLKHDESCSSAFCFLEEHLEGILNPQAQEDKRLFTSLVDAQSQCRYLQGDIGGAVAALERADPTFLDASARSKLTQMRRMAGLKRQGNLHFSKRELQKAVNLYTSALQVDPKCDFYNAVLYSNRAAAHLAANNFKLAKADCDIALKLKPNYIKALLRRAHAGAQFDTEAALLQAKVDFTKAFQLDSTKLMQYKREFMELEIKITSFQKRAKERQEAAARGGRQRGGNSTPKSQRPPSRAGSSFPSSSSSSRFRNDHRTDEEKRGARARPGQPSNRARSGSARPASASGTASPSSKGFKSWKEKQDDYWQNWFKSARNSGGGSSSKQRSASSSSRPNSSYGSSNRSYKSSSGSSSSGGRSGFGFGGNNTSDWLDSRGRVKNFYKPLGLSEKNVERSAVKKAFHKLALRFHPDKNQGDSESDRRAKEQTFKLISEAYAVLGDDRKREQYGRFFRCLASR